MPKPTTRTKPPPEPPGYYRVAPGREEERPALAPAVRWRPIPGYWRQPRPDLVQLPLPIDGDGEAAAD